VSGPVTFPPRTVGALASKKRVVVCCGAGGVGKTTSAAALSIAAAQLGRKVLVLTIDPSRRLAEALGVERNPPRPVAMSAERTLAAGITGAGSLEAWMLDPKRVADETVRRFAKSTEDAASIMSNRIYQEASNMVAGFHEYTAMKALHQFITEGAYDLVVLDTPPSRNALDFLEAPSRLARFLDGAIFQLFLPTRGGVLANAASKVVSKVLGLVFGRDFTNELAQFFELFSQLLGSVNKDLSGMRELLSRPDVGFLLVTSPTSAALTEAHFFHDKIKLLGLPFSGFVLNRSHARVDGKVFPAATLLDGDAGPEAVSGLEKLKAYARTEQLCSTRDKGLLADLALRAGETGFAMALPNVVSGAHDVGTLVTLAKAMLDERRSGPRA
jgi:anion-transporting  ArsA/GET3 family ATPase